MALTPILPASKSRPPMDARQTGIFALLGLQFSFVTWILIGATLQTLAFYLFSSRRYTLLIAVIVLTARLVRSCIQSSSPSRNPYLEGVIPGRTTAFIPNESGEIEGPAAEKVAVLLLGIKVNHPFGFLSSQFRKIGPFNQRMLDALDAGEASGFMGYSTYYRQDARGAPELCSISYWRSVEDLWAFAHGPLHREAWLWWEKNVKENGYLGVSHEIYEVEKSHWENVYLNFQPTLIGATSFLKKGDRKLEGGVVSDEFISPLIDARRGKYAKSSARFGRNDTEFDSNRVGKEIYGTA